MKARRTYWTTVREGGRWYVVSTLYEPPSPGNIGSGIFCCTPHKTRAAARAAIKAGRFY